MSASPIRQQCYTSETATEGLHKLLKENIATCSYEQPHPQPRRTVRKTCMAHELRRVPGSTQTRFIHAKQMRDFNSCCPALQSPTPLWAPALVFKPCMHRCMHSIVRARAHTLL